MSKRKAGPSFGPVPHLRSLRMQARRAGPAAASFSSHVAQGFSLHLHSTIRASINGSFPPPRICQLKLVGSDGCTCDGTTAGRSSRRA